MVLAECSGFFACLLQGDLAEACFGLILPIWSMQSVLRGVCRVNVRGSFQVLGAAQMRDRTATMQPGF